MEGTLSKILVHAGQLLNPQPIHVIKVVRKDTAIFFIIRRRVDSGIAAIYGANT